MHRSGTLVVHPQNAPECNAGRRSNLTRILGVIKPDNWPLYSELTELLLLPGSGAFVIGGPFWRIDARSPDHNRRSRPPTPPRSRLLNNFFRVRREFGRKRKKQGRNTFVRVSFENVVNKSHKSKVGGCKS